MSDFDTGTASTLPIDVNIPGYRLRRHVGDDALCLWLDAEQESLGRKVTLRVLKPQYEAHPAARKEFLAEMDRLSGLDHPDIVRVYDSAREGTLMLVTERIGIRTLQARLRPEKGLPEGEAFRCAGALARALKYLTGKGLAHKNVCPRFVQLREDGGSRLITLRNVIPSEEQAKLKGRLAQDARYIAPEQLTGDDEVGPPAHVYQLGALIWHMLCGKPAYAGDDVKAVARMHLKGEFPSLRTGLPFVKQGHINFVAACTQRDPSMRPDFERVIAGLEKLLDGKDPGVAPEAGAAGVAAPRPRKWKRRRR